MSVPKWAIDFVPNLMDLNTWEQHPEFEIIGPVIGWSEEALIKDFYEEANLTTLAANTKYYPTEQEMNNARMECYKHRTKPCLFISWNPDIFSEFLEYEEVYHLLWDKYFPVNTLMKVWSSNISLEAKLSISNYQVTNDQIQQMLLYFIRSGSFTLAEGDEKYEETLREAVNRLFCPGPDCISIQHFPRVRSPDLPDQLVLWTERCLGFAGTLEDDFPLLCTQDMEENWLEGGLRGRINGFSVDLLIGPGGILENLGYSYTDITIRCSENVNENLRLVSAGLGDLSIGCTTITEPRMRQVDLSTAYLSTGYQLLVTKTPLDPFWAIFSAPVADEVWIAVGALLVGFSFLLFITENLRQFLNARLDEVEENETEESEDGASSLSSDKIKKTRTIHKFVFQQLSVFAILIGRDGQIEEVKTLAGRFIGSFLLLFGVLFCSIWTANLAATLTVAQLAEVQGIEDIRGQAVTTMCSANGEKNFVQEYLEGNFPDIAIECVYGDLSEMVEVLKSNDEIKAAIWDLEVLKLLANDDCDLELVGEIFGKQELGFYTPHDSPLYQPLNEAVAHFRFGQVSADAYESYFETGTCTGSNKQNHNENNQLQIENLAGLFFVTIVPAVIVCFLKIGYEIRRWSLRAKPHHHSDTSEHIIHKVYSQVKQRWTQVRSHRQRKSDENPICSQLHKLSSLINKRWKQQGGQRQSERSNDSIFPLDSTL